MARWAGATVSFDPQRIDRAGIVAAIEAAGYGVATDVPSAASADDGPAAEEALHAAERRSLLTGALASLGIAFLPSLVCGVITALLVYRTGKILQSTQAGLMGATLAWIAPSMAEASVNARGYALATAF